MSRVVFHPLDDIEAGHITDRLHRDGIDLAVRIVDRIAHLYPTHDVTTSEEVYALAAFLEATDTPLHWHRAQNVTAKQEGGDPQ